MAKEKKLEDALKALEEIKTWFNDEVIKSVEIPPLVNTKTGKEVGFGIKMQLNGKYEYAEHILEQFKNKLQADDYIVRVKQSKLFVTFKVRNFTPTEEHIWRMAHAIGMDNIKPEKGVFNAYRRSSFYNSPDEIWDELVLSGYADVCRNGDNYIYVVCDKGFKLLAKTYHLTIKYTSEYE